MAADLQKLREQLENCTDPGKRLALQKRLKELEVQRIKAEKAKKR